MKVSQVMTRDVKTVRPDQTAKDAAKFMLSEDAGSMPVSEGDRLIGASAQELSGIGANIFGSYFNFSKANLIAPPVSEISVGGLKVKLQSTKLADVNKRLGGTIMSKGDATWLCYHADDTNTWFISNAFGGQEFVMMVAVEANKKTPGDCEAANDKFKPPVFDVPGIGAKLSEYHTGYRAFSRQLLESIDLETGAERPLTSVPPEFSVQDIAISPDGLQAWVTAKKDNIARGPVRDGVVTECPHGDGSPPYRVRSPPRWPLRSACSRARFSLGFS